MQYHSLMYSFIWIIMVVFDKWMPSDLPLVGILKIEQTHSEGGSLLK